MKSIQRREFIRATCLTTIGTILLPNITSALGKTENRLNGKKILYVYGGWDGHEPKQSVDLFVPWLKSEGAEVIRNNFV